MLLQFSWSQSVVVAVYTVCCDGCIYSLLWWLYIQFVVMAVYTVCCSGCIYSLLWWLYIQSVVVAVYTVCVVAVYTACVVAVYTVCCGGCIYSLCGGCIYSLCGGCIYSLCGGCIYSLCGGCIYSLCGGCIYSLLWWLYIQSVVVAVYTVCMLMLLSCWPGTYLCENPNCKLYYQQLHLKYWCNLARYWLQAPWGWHDSVETCSSVIICEIIVCICWSECKTIKEMHGTFIKICTYCCRVCLFYIKIWKFWCVCGRVYLLSVPYITEFRW